MPAAPGEWSDAQIRAYVDGKYKKLVDSILNGELYTKHAHKHDRGQQDPLRAQSQGANGFGFGYNYLVDANWATQVANGLGVEGELRTLSSGSTFRIYSTVAGAVTRSNTDFASTTPWTIFVRPGTYAESITVASGQFVSIIGASKESVVIGGLTTSSGSTVSVPETFIAASQASIWMTGFTLKTNHSASGTASSGLKTTNATNVTIWDCQLTGNASVGVEYAVRFGGSSTNGNAMYVTDCTVTSYGVTASTNCPVLISNCPARSGTIAYAVTEDSIVHGCQIISYTTGISILDGANDVSLWNNQFTSVTTAIKCAGNNAISVLIDGNTTDTVTTFFDFSSLTFSATTTGGITVSNNRGAVSTAFAFPSSAIAMPMDLHDNAWWGPSGAGTIALTSGAIHPMQRMSNNWIDSSSSTPAQEIIDGALNRKFTAGIYWVENTSPLTIGVSAHTIRFGDTDVAVTRQTVALTGSSATNFVEINSSGTLSSNTSAFTAGTFHVIKIVTTAAGTATYSSHTDVGGVLFVNAGSTTLDAIYLRRDGTTPLTGKWDQSGAFDIVQRGGNLIVAGGTANSTNLKLYSDNSASPGTLVGTWNAATGSIGLGSAGATAYEALFDGRVFTDPTTRHAAVADNSQIAITADSSLAHAFFSLAPTFVTADASGHTFTGIISGLLVAPSIGINTGTPTLTANDIRGAYLQATILTKGAVVDRYGVYVRNALGGGSLTNQYGVYIENMAKGGTINRAIYAAGGISVHAGAFHIGGTAAPDAKTILDLTTATTGLGLLIPTQTTANAPSSSTNGTLWYDSTTNKFRARENGADVNVIGGGSGNVATDAIWDAAGDLAVGTGADTAAKLSLTVPGSVGPTSVLGVVNGETTPTWKTTRTHVKRVPAAAFWPSTTSGCGRTLYNGASNAVNTPTLDFDATAVEYAETILALDDWNGGTFTYKVVWMTASTTTSHTAHFEVAAGSYGNGETLDAALGTAVAVEDDVVNATANQVLITAASTAVTPANGTAGDFLRCRLLRDPTSANDDLNVDARVLEVQITYTETL